MTTAQQALEYMEAWEGYHDNTGAKVWAKYAPVNYTPSSYCGAGQGMVCKELGLSLAPTTHQRIIYVPYVVQDARAAGKWLYSKDSKPGDWVIFCWSGGYHDQAAGNADHIGMIVSNNPSLPYVYTAEFNTTGNGAGSRGFFYRRRSRDFIMGCVDRSAAYSGKGSTTVPKQPKKRKSSKPAKLKVDGVIGTHSTQALQFVLGSTVDGVISGQPRSIRTSRAEDQTLDQCWPTIKYGHGGSQAIARLQRKCGAHADGYFGPKTEKSLQKWLGVKVDGLPGPNTCKHLQQWINKQLEK